MCLKTRAKLISIKATLTQSLSEYSFMIYLKIIYFNTIDTFGLHLLCGYFMPSCLEWSIPEPKNARPYLEQNNVSMMSQTSDAIWSWHIPLLLSSSRTPPGSTVGLLLLLCFSIGLAVEYSSCFILVFYLDLFVAVLIHWLVEDLHENRTTYMFMKHSRI